MKPRKLIGHDVVLKVAHNLCQKHRPITLLFEGPKGVGKWLAAESLASSLTEQHNICKFEPTTAVRTHSTSSISIFYSSIHMYPWNSSLHCFLFNDVDRMTATVAAQLLKTLEEPPHNSVVIILVSSFPERVLPTILSRCVRLRFALLDEEEMMQVFQQQDITAVNEDARSHLMVLGSPGAAICKLKFFNEGWYDIIRELTHDIPISTKKFVKNLSQLETLAASYTQSSEGSTERVELFWESLLESLLASPDLNASPLRIAHDLAQAREVSRRGLSPKSILESLWIKWNFVDIG